MGKTLRAPWTFAIAAALLAIFFLQMFLASGVKSPAWDEPGDIAAGLAYVQLGTLAVNPQHPPLLKALSGLSLTLAGARWPDVQPARELLQGKSAWQWDVGSFILIQTGQTHAGLDRALLWARLPMMLVGAMGGLIVFLWGRRLAGELAALCALLLYCLDPTIVSHSYLVTLDVGLGAFTLLFLFCLWLYVCTPRTLTLVFCGITLGLLLCTKFSSLVLLPVAAVLLLAGRYQRPAPNAAPDAPCPCGSGRKFKNCHAGKPQPRFDPHALISAAQSLAWMGAVAFVVVEAIYRLHSPAAYLDGVSQVNADHSANYLTYMAGQMAPNFTSYFAVAYLLKEPLAAIALAAAGLVLCVRNKNFPARDKLFLLLPPAVLFLVHTWKADNLGVRYIIPCLGFAHLLGGIALAALWTASSPAKKCMAAVLCAWLMAAAAGIYPDHISYFNEAACLLNDPARLGLDGGSRCGGAWLDDSNIDWGGGLKQLKVWMDRNAKGRTARLAYFGSFPVAAYDLPVESIDASQLYFKPPPGLYAVSAHFVAHFSALVRTGHSYGDLWMLRTPPVAVIGHCLYIYDLPGKVATLPPQSKEKPREAEGQKDAGESLGPSS